MIHRVVFGSIERFIGVITEHFAGAFPTWLSPVQVKVLPITDRCAEYAESVRAALDAAGIRAEADLRNEKIGYKIREAQLQKICSSWVTRRRRTPPCPSAPAPARTAARCRSWTS